MSRRKWLNKSLEKSFFIFCEWESEKCYFNELKQYLNLSNLKEIEVIWQLPRNNIDKLKRIKSTLHKKSNYTLKDFKNTKSQIFILLDIDNKICQHPLSQDDINFFRTNLENDYIKIFFSNYDFELWILLHFILYKKENNNYIEEIEKISWLNYEKWDRFCSIKFYREIIEKNLITAFSNAKEIEEFNISQWKTILKEMIPYTEVYKLIEILSEK